MRFQVPINVPAWWLIMMPVLMILLIGIIVLIAINIVNTKQKNTEDKGEEAENKKSKDKTLTSWIKKKDLLYWLLIVCLGTISLFTFRYKDATEVISHWSFAGTIVSIILAVIAIGFTLFQTLSSNLSSEKIAESADKIEKASEGIDTEELLKSSIIMKDAAEFLKNEITNIKSNLEDIKVGQESSNSKLNDYFNNNGVQEQLDEEELTTEEQLTDVVLNLEYFTKNVFGKLPLYTRLFSYSMFKLKHHKLYTTKNVKSLANIFSDIDINSDDEEVIAYRLGVNLGTAGSTKSFLAILGLIKEFIEKSEQERIDILNILENSLQEKKNHHISALKEFIEEKQK